MLNKGGYRKKSAGGVKVKIREEGQEEEARLRGECLSVMKERGQSQQV